MERSLTFRFIRGRKTPSGRHIFDRECVRLNIEHRLTNPYTPKTNGMVERFKGRIEEILERNRFDSYNKLTEALNGYLKCYNHFNKQKSLGYKTPKDVIMDWFKIKPEIFKEEFNISSYNLLQPDR